MIREIVKYPEPVLARKADAVTSFDAELEALVADMFESMYARGSGWQPRRSVFPNE